MVEQFPTVSMSLWLPISRSNFFNRAENDWFRQRGAGHGAICSSARIEQENYIPLLLVGVLRRLLEVMPRSFGYDRVGRCRLRGDSSSRNRPVDVTMTLDLTRPHAEPLLPEFWHAANDALVVQGVIGVELFVDENGWYAFTATHHPQADAAGVSAALIQHIRQVFGGDYVVHPLPSISRRIDTGSSSLKDYNGLRDNDGFDRDIDNDDIVVTQPRAPSRSISSTSWPRACGTTRYHRPCT